MSRIRQEDATLKSLAKYLKKGMVCDSTKWLSEFATYQTKGGSNTLPLMKIKAQHEFQLLAKSAQTDADELNKLDEYIGLDGTIFAGLRQHGLESDDEAESHVFQLSISNTLSNHSRCASPLVWG